MKNLRFLSYCSGFLLLLTRCLGYYYEGAAPVNYCPKGADLDGHCKSEIYVYVNRLSSAESVIPYEYEHFDFCPSFDIFPSPTENLGQVVFGDRIRSSPYKFIFKNDTRGIVCVRMYDGNEYAKKKIDTLRDGIRLNYQQHWIIDNMPVTSCYITDHVKDPNKNICYPSFPVGCYVDKYKRGKDDCHSLLPRTEIQPDTAYVFNHVEISIEYHPYSSDWPGNVPTSSGRLLKAQVTKLASIQDPKTGKPLVLPPSSEKIPKLEIAYSVAVTFRKNPNVKWSSRWGYILDSIPNANIELFSIINSVIIVLFLSGNVAKILVRILCCSASKYKQLDNSGCPQKVSRGKLIHDVFRPPCMGMLLSIFLGSGVQIFFMTLITLIFASSGFLSPANRGALTTCGLVLYVCLGIPAGYVSSRIYKMFVGEMRVRNVLLTAFLCPGIIFFIVFILDFLFWSMRSSAALPFTTIVALLGLWFGVSVPLTCVGAYFGFKQKTIEHPVRTDLFPRQIPDQPIYETPLLSIVMGHFSITCLDFCPLSFCFSLLPVWR